MSVNDLYNNGTSLVFGVSNGSYFVFTNGVYTNYLTSLDTIQKILVVDGNVWAFGYDLLWIKNMSFPIKLAVSFPI